MALVRGLRAALDRVLGGGFLLLLVLAPLPLGGNTPLAWTVLSLVIAGLLLIWSLRTALWPSRDQVDPMRVAAAGLLFALVALWVVVQVLPYTPRAWHHPLWLYAADALGPGRIRGRISLDPFASATAAMRLIAYAGVFWLALQLAATRGGARRIVVAIAVAGLAYAVYGLLAYLVWPDHILWWRKWFWMPGVHSTFVNQNSYATYAGLGLLCAVGLLVTKVYGEARRGLRDLLGWWPVVAVLVIGLALVLTQSRAGTSATALGLAVLFAAFGLTRRMRARDAALAAAALAGVGILVFVLAGDDLARRLAETDFAGEARFPIFERVMAGIADAPWTGVGYGTFAQAFRSYVGTLSTGFWDHAHNTYLENAFELGVPAAALLVGAVLLTLAACARGLRERSRNALYPCLALAASAVVGFHALLDFSLQMPAVAITYAALLGAGCARAGGRERRVVGAHRAPGRWPGPALAAGCAVILLALAVPRFVSLAIALPASQTHEGLSRQISMPVGRLDRAIGAAGAAAEWSNASRLLWSRGVAELAQAHRPGLDERPRRAWLERAEGSLAASLAGAPANPVAWAQLAYARLLLGRSRSQVDRALALSALIGPNHIPLLAFRASVAAAAWDGLDRNTKALYRAQFVQAMRYAGSPFVAGLSQVEDVEMVRDSLADMPGLLHRFDRMRRFQ
jgi:O-antigen ligase